MTAAAAPVQIVTIMKPTAARALAAELVSLAEVAAGSARAASKDAFTMHRTVHGPQAVALALAELRAAASAILEKAEELDGAAFAHQRRAAGVALVVELVP